MDYRQKIGNAALWSTATEIIAKLISPLVSIILARLLVPEEFGIVATITMVISFAEVFTDAGFQKYIVQREFKAEKDLDDSTNVAFWTNFSVSILACALIFAFRHGIAKAVGNPGLGNPISIASISILLFAFSSIQTARFKRKLNFKALFIARMGTSAIPLIVTIPLALILRNYWAMLIGSLTANLFNAIALSVLSDWRPRFFYRWNILKEMISFSVWSLAESICSWFTGYIGVFIVGHYLNDYYLGVYKTAMSTVNSYVGLAVSAIMPVVFSALSRCQNDEEQFRAVHYRFQRLMSILILPMCVGIFLFRDLVTQILLGSQWLEASGFIGIWSLTTSTTILFSHFAMEVYRSKGRPQVAFFDGLLHVLFIVPTLLVFVHYRFETLYIARSLIKLQSAITSLVIMQILFHFRIVDALKNVFPAFVSTVIMAVVGAALKNLSNRIMWQFAVILICICVYFAALFLLFPKVRREVVQAAPIQKILHRMKLLKG